MGDAVAGIGIGNHDTLRCCGRLSGGAQRFQQPPPDIPDQWTCLACGQERVWPKSLLQVCGCPKSHVQLPDPKLDPWVGLPKGRLPRTRPSGPIGVRTTSLSLRLVRRRISLRWPSLCRLAQLMLLRLALFTRSQRDALIGSLPLCNRS